MPPRPDADFVTWFRSVAPYFHAFRGRTFVIAFGGELVAERRFVSLAQDLSLLHSAGIRLVLVHGSRPQIEAQLKARRLRSRYHKGLRVTDPAALECVKEAVGLLRVEIDALLSLGLPNTPMAGAAINTVSGNFITARPMGVHDGVDYLHTGRVRKVDAQAISACLDGGNIVVVSPIGYSPTGEVFNLAMEEVAVTTATALRAAKLVFLSDAAVLDIDGTVRAELSANEAERLLAQGSGRLSKDTRAYLARAVEAVRANVERAHVVTRSVDGAGPARSRRGARPSPQHPDAAVHADGLPGDVGRVVGGEEAHGARDVLGRAQAAQCDRVKQRLLAGLAHRVPLGLRGRVRAHEARRDAVHANAVRAELGRPGLMEVLSVVGLEEQPRGRLTGGVAGQLGERGADRCGSSCRHEAQECLTVDPRCGRLAPQTLLAGRRNGRGHGFPLRQPIGRRRGPCCPRLP